MNTQAIQTQQAGLALLRVALGVMWITHALLKVFVFTLPGTAQFFESQGIPGFLAYPVVLAELLGGIAILFGVYARQLAILMTPILLVAASVHWPNGWVFSNPGGGWEYPIFLAIVSVVVWLSGEGAFTLRSSKRLALA